MTGAQMRGKPVDGPDSPRWLLARLLRPTLAKLVLALYRVRITGAEKVPRSGALLAGNHLSHLDPILLWCASPRPAHFIAKQELWDSKVLGWLLDRLWGFPVNRAGADRDAINTATELLTHGDLVGMFPEGTRRRDDSVDMGEAHDGVSFIANRAGVPVVPIAISGTDKAWPPGQKFPRLARVTITVCDPVVPDDFEGGRKERVSAMTAEVMRRIAEARASSQEV